MIEPGSTSEGAPQWVLRMATTTYTVALDADRSRLELRSWGPAGIEFGPSPLAFAGPTPFLTSADFAPLEYVALGMRRFAGVDLVAEVEGDVRGTRWEYTGEQIRSGSGTDTLSLTFTDTVQMLRATLCYRIDARTDVVERWVEVTNEGIRPLRLERFDSAGFCIPAPGGARIGYLSGQWAQEFGVGQVDLHHGRFEIGSTQGIAGHAFAPRVAVQDLGTPDGPTTPTWGVALGWSGSWRLTVESDTAGLTRVSTGRVPHEGALWLAPGDTVSSPIAAGAYSGEGLDGLARAWHAHERLIAASRPIGRAPTIVYNSWYATEFAIDAAEQIELAEIAADLGVETFVVDDGWFVGRDDDRGGLGDWTPDPAKFPDGFEAFVARIRVLGLNFGLWVEPEAISPASRLYAEHPEWVYRLDGRPSTLIRNQYLLDLGRDDVADFVLRTLDGLLSRYDISYLKWDMNRPVTEPGRPGADNGRSDLDGRHVRTLYRIIDELHRAHPDVVIEGCAAGGARTDHAAASRFDVLWPSDNTGPMDRLAVQHGFLHAHAPHLMSSWVTDESGFFDRRPRSLRFRFVLAMAGVLGIGADIRAWSPEQRREAAHWIGFYKSVKDVIHHGAVHLVGSPRENRCAVQYTSTDGGRVVVLAWNTGVLDGMGTLPTRVTRLPLHGLDPRAFYRDRQTGQSYSGSHLRAVGLPAQWTVDLDAHAIVLDRS